ncbi:MAG TPA: ATP synthase F0 subunit B [Candidatus Binatia bacterium]|nr:ATP synthase F0 subunit B [Candidatus Binatia bacterium]
MHAVLAVTLFTFVVPVKSLIAQEGAKPASSATTIPSTQEEPKSEKAEGREKVKEGEEADAIRNAPAVKWIARHTGLTNDGAYWLCIGLNFAVIFFAMAGLLRKILPGYFKGRTSTIQKGIEEARKMSEDARRRLAEVEGRLSRLDADIAAMQSEADENAKAEEQRLLAAGEEERRRIVASAEQEIEMAANTARRELKAYVAELAVQLAEKKIRVSQDTDEALVRAFTAQMGKDSN